MKYNLTYINFPKNLHIYMNKIENRVKLVEIAFHNIHIECHTSCSLFK